MAKETIVLQSRAAIQNIIPGTPRLVSPGMVITSDNFSGDGSVSGRKTDAAMGGVPMLWDAIGQGASVISTSNNSIVFSGAGVNDYVGFSDLFTSDLFVTFSVHGTPKTDFDVRVACRYVTSGNFCYINFTAANFTIGKIVNSVRTTIIGASPWVEGDTVGIKVKDGRVSKFRNGVEVGSTAIDPDISAMTSQSFAFVPGTPSPTIRFKNLKIEAV